MWTESLLSAVYLINRTPSKVLNGKTPFELVFGHEPNISHLKTFGCLCFATKLNVADKFSERSENCVMMGYSSFKKAYKLFSLESKQFFIFQRCQIL